MIDEEEGKKKKTDIFGTEILSHETRGHTDSKKVFDKYLERAITRFFLYIFDHLATY
jgi:hypothetical protein